MSATLNYRKYVTPSLSTYPWINLYSKAHIIKGIWVPLPSCPCSDLAGVDEGVRDLAPARVQIRSVVAGAKVGDLDLACTIIEARVWKYMREGAVGELRGSQATVPMAPSVRSRVAEGAAGEWRRRP